MVETDLVERILKRNAALDFVGLDHRREHMLHGERMLTFGDRRP
jgi:hypothetical protein